MFKNKDQLDDNCITLILHLSRLWRIRPWQSSCPPCVDYDVSFWLGSLCVDLFGNYARFGSLSFVEITLLPRLVRCWGRAIYTSDLWGSCEHSGASSIILGINPLILDLQVFPTVLLYVSSSFAVFWWFPPAWSAHTCFPGRTPFSSAFHMLSSSAQAFSEPPPTPPPSPPWPSHRYSGNSRVFPNPSAFCVVVSLMMWWLMFVGGIDLGGFCCRGWNCSWAHEERSEGFWVCCLADLITLFPCPSVKSGFGDKTWN